MLPDTTQDTGGTFNLSLVLKDSDGKNFDSAHLKISYDRDGKLKWLSLPNTPIIFENQWYPALTVYNGKLYSLPVSNGYYKYLNKLIQQNEGGVNIDHLDREFTIELLGE